MIRLLKLVCLLWLSTQVANGLAQTKTRIDIAIGYAPTLEAQYGGAEGVRARINAFVNLFNLSFDNSQINACVVATDVYKSVHNIKERNEFDDYKNFSETVNKRNSAKADLMIYFADTYDSSGGPCIPGSCGIRLVVDNYNGSSNRAYTMINFHRTLSSLNTISMAGYIGAIRAVSATLDTVVGDYQGYCWEGWPSIATVNAHAPQEPSCTGEQHPVFSGPNSYVDYPIRVNADGSISSMGVVRVGPMGNSARNNAAKVENVKDIVAGFRDNPGALSCTGSDVNIVPILQLLLLDE